MMSPLEQFGLSLFCPVSFSVGGCFFDFSVTMSFVMNMLILLILMGLFMNTSKYIWNQTGKVLVGSKLVEFVYVTIVQQSGSAGLVYFPMLFTLFCLILFSNVLGLIPLSFTNTSQIGITLTFGLSMVLGIMMLGFYLKGFGFLSIFVPSNVPLVLLPFLVVIEVVSFLMSPMSLSLSLCANMMAGHMSLHIMGSFSFALFYSFYTFGYLGAWFLIVIMFVLEFGIAFLQAYVFLMLVCVYLNDAILVGGHWGCN